MKARYLLRFDDICPTVNWRVWDEVETILCEQQIRPILAVVPDNQDEALRVSAPDKQFWVRVREWKKRGWTIGMHGWQHEFVTRDQGILKVNRCSEFAGLSRAEQQYKLGRACEIFAREGLACNVFIAPAHSFDATTLQVLAELGFRYISDGFFPVPLVDRFRITWVPQQLWSYRWRPFGVWTICFHINSWTEADIAAFKDHTLRYREAISRFETVVEQSPVRRQTVSDVIAGRVYRSATQLGALGKAKLLRLIAPSPGKGSRSTRERTAAKGPGGTTLGSVNTTERVPTHNS
jgi:predicted deacetylase